MPVDYFFIHTAEVDDHLLYDCAALLVDNNAALQHNAQVDEQAIASEISRLQSQFLVSDDCFIVIAVDGSSGQHIGQAFCVHFNVAVGLRMDRVLFFTQLVVDRSFRRSGVATQLCKMARAHYNADSFGIISSSPYAIRALQRACGLDLSSSISMELGPKVFENCPVPCVRNAVPKFGNERCVVVTNSSLSHEHVDLQLNDGWPFGTVKDGEEFFIVLHRENDSVLHSLNPSAAPTPIKVPIAGFAFSESNNSLEHLMDRTQSNDPQEVSVAFPLMSCDPNEDERAIPKDKEEEKGLKRIKKAPMLLSGTMIVAFAAAALYPDSLTTLFKSLVTFGSFLSNHELVKGFRVRRI